MIKVFDRFDSHLEVLWRKIEKEGKCTPFQTFSWCRAFWENVLSPVKGNSLFVIYSEDEKTGVSLLMPLFVDKRKTLRFIGDSHSDIGDAILAGCGNKHYLFNDVFQFVLSECKIRSIVLQKMPATSEAMAFSGAMLKGSILYRDHAYSWINFSKSIHFPEGQNHLRSRERKQFNAILKRFADTTLVVCSCSQGDEFPLRDIEEIRDVMVAKRWRKRSYLSSEMMSFLKRNFDEGCLDVLFLEQNGQKKAVSLVIRSWDAAYTYLMLYRDKKYNTPLNARIIDFLSANGVLCYNFGVGVYGYKLKKFRPELSCTYCLRYSKSVIHRIFDYLMMVVRFIRQG
jgi:hypothetical protein